MSRQASLWLFFVIVAVGLALSWGQIGRKTERAFDAEPVVLLVTETPCRPRSAPCAAVAGDRALVVGPDGAGLAFRQAGFDAARIVRVEVSALARDGSEISAMVAERIDGVWRLPEVGRGVAILRVRLVGNRETTVADFPL